MWRHLGDALWGVSPAYALASPGGGDDVPFYMTVAPFILMFAIIYFIMIRPQQKLRQDHQSMLSALKVGDNVIASGMYGEIIKIKDEALHLKVADNVRIRVQRSAVTAKTTPADDPDTSKS
jgi:preprotein translocase subunit YajC